jgi:hypothetical protein
MELLPKIAPAGRVSVKSIAFYHPVYSKTPLFRLFAFDCDGVDYDIALAACRIVACNAHGYFTDEGGHPVDETETSVLSGAKYFYHLHPGELVGDSGSGEEGPLHPYPICPCFDDWQFPHGALPEWWPDDKCVYTDKAAQSLADIDKILDLRDHGRCVLSNTSDWVERAHIVPVKRPTWFADQDMVNYIEVENDKHGINAAANRMLLKSDLHKSFDGFEWTAIPAKGRWAARFFKKTDSLGFIYNNHEVGIMEGVAPQLLFARFAMIIFDSLISFISGYRLYPIPIKVKGKPTTLTLTYAKSILPAECGATPGSRGSAGRKRSRPNTPHETNPPRDNDDDNPFFDSSFESSTLVDNDEEGDDDNGCAVDEKLYSAVDVSCDADGSIHGSKKRRSSFDGAIVAVDQVALRQKLLGFPLQAITHDEGWGAEQRVGCL